MGAAGRGAWAVVVGRMLPFVRAFTSIVAGLVRIPAIKFGVLSLIGTVIYATVLSLIGYGLGHAWNSVDHGLTLVGYALFALLVVAIAGFVVYRLRQFRREAAQARVTEAGEAARAAEEQREKPAPPKGPGRHRSDAEV